MRQRGWKVEFSHSLWEGNQCANFLSKMGLNLRESLQMVTHMSTLVESLVLAMQWVLDSFGCNFFCFLYYFLVQKKNS
uniref:RNase H type-1 domain-containing protein n=1 Tax=Cajanus cajan TaxID=3821 RepID=A0A151REX5_CAJCA|nr:hypothetical protein KK1_037616 [Cajanus cajan]